MSSRFALFVALLLNSILHSTLLSAPSHAGFFDCLRIYRSIKNPEIQLNLKQYTNLPTRPLAQYKLKLGNEFQERVTQFTADSVYFDLGAGFGLTAAQLSERYLGQFHAVNYQDFWTELAQSPNDARSKEVLPSLAWALGVSTKNLKHHEAIKATLQEFHQLQKKHAFFYHTGRAEDFLVRVGKLADLITDVFGAYFYSHPRHQVLQMIYQRLKPGGIALIVLSESPEHAHHPQSILGPQDQVSWIDESGQNRVLPLPEFLAARFPKQVKIQDRVLRLERPLQEPQLELNLDALLETIRSYEHPFQSRSKLYSSEYKVKS